MAQNHGPKTTGAVLVQGGGIAGVQAALDLANSGYRVHIVEKSAAIGGTMARLDKTFPTGDCATCIVSPKLVECSRNLNIHIHTLSELVAIDGSPGHFKTRIQKSPRFVDEHKCNDCGDCTPVCPVEIDDCFNEGLAFRKAIAKTSAQAIPNRPAIEKHGHAPCKLACPAGINVQGYIQLVKQKKYVQAVRLIRERNPLAAICGRVCTHPCESACTRAEVDSPLAIRQLKRFACDREMALVAAGELKLPPVQSPSPDAPKVAIIGAGPAGLTAAQDLADRGYAVTVFEASPEAGGMLRWGIPEYRLPNTILDYEVELIRRKGVHFHFNCRVGRDVEVNTLKNEFDAQFVAIGTQQSMRLGVKGEELKGVRGALGVLNLIAGAGSGPNLWGHVMVIGGGDAAMDAARCALRVGADRVTVLYRRSRDEMPALAHEVELAVREGVQFSFLTAPVEFAGDKDGKLQQVRCIKMRLEGAGDAARPRPVPIPGSEFDLAADTVIVAIGSQPDPLLGATPAGLKCNRRSLVRCDEEGRTSVPGWFAGGDIVSGPATVIEAVAAGKRAAESIHHYLQGKPAPQERFSDSLRPVPDELLPSTDDILPQPRALATELPVAQRSADFTEIEQVFSASQALAEAGRCLNCGGCCECGECVAVCDKGAVDHTMATEIIELDVGAVILAPGLKPFAAARAGAYGYGRFANVITGVQFERMLSAAGPFQGQLKRLSDGAPARRIAWIQCVGSRDYKTALSRTDRPNGPNGSDGSDGRCSGNRYCSSVCCMATTKQALVAREHADGISATIFYLDIRAFGKNFDAYYERARADEDIHYVQCIPSRVTELAQSGVLRLRYVGCNKETTEADFDLVVLSVGIEPAAGVSAAAAHLGIRVNAHGFCETERSAPLATSRPGVFVAGAFQEPKDIPATVTQAGGAAAMAMALLADSRNTLTVKPIFPDQRDITDEPPRIGVFVCHCGLNIAGVVDVEAVTAAVADEPHVILATHHLYACADANLAELKAVIARHRLNRVVVASCTPRTHEALFRQTLREAGLNPYLFELANIRDQCSWVHADHPPAATRKAIQLVRMSVARARLLKPLQGESLKVDSAGLVVGGGLSGMTAALSLAEQGFMVDIVEQSDRLGGQLRDISATLDHEDTGELVSLIVEQVTHHPRIRCSLNARVRSVAGHVGKFRIGIVRDEKPQEITCGAIVVATGAEPAPAESFGWADSSHVITQSELALDLQRNRLPDAGQTIVMIQCVDSRNAQRPYCSRVCCAMAIHNALRLKATRPGIHVIVLYRDIRTYGFRESYYREARQAGVIFIRYRRTAPPQVAHQDGLRVTVESPDLMKAISIPADRVVLSTGVQAPADNRTLAERLKVPLNDDGFYAEAHLKLRPVDCATEGIFLCGLAHSPKYIDENIAQAKAAAARAATVLSKTHLEAAAQVSTVDQSKCISCMTCVHTCPYGAPHLNSDNKAAVAAAKCLGCGLCAAECPARAIRLSHFEAGHFNSMLDSLFDSLGEIDAATGGVSSPVQPARLEGLKN